MIGKIVRRPLREVWKHEALDFTTWLVENIDVLSEALDLPLQDAKREQAAGDFSVDLVAEDDKGNTVVIENQLEKSNHDHLGKLVTYLAALDARVAVWIVSEPRPEHTNAITWLNEFRQANFYLVKAEAISIDKSNPACLFTRFCGEKTRRICSILRPTSAPWNAASSQIHSLERRFLWSSVLCFGDTVSKKPLKIGVLEPSDGRRV